jgi:hypothetical protein
MSKLLRRFKNLRESRKMTFGEQLDVVFKNAVAEAVEKHRLAGNSIPVFRSGRVILIPPEQIEPLSLKVHKKGRINFAIPRKRRYKKVARVKSSLSTATIRRSTARS